MHRGRHRPGPARIRARRRYHRRGYRSGHHHRPHGRRGQRGRTGHRCEDRTTASASCLGSAAGRQARHRRRGVAASSRDSAAGRPDAACRWNHRTRTGCCPAGERLSAVPCRSCRVRRDCCRDADRTDASPDRAWGRPARQGGRHRVFHRDGRGRRDGPSLLGGPASAARGRASPASDPATPVRWPASARPVPDLRSVWLRLAPALVGPFPLVPARVRPSLAQPSSQAPALPPAWRQVAHRRTPRAVCVLRGPRWSTRPT